MAMDVRIHPLNPDIVFASHGNFSSFGHGIYRSTDAGASWSPIQNGATGITRGMDVLDFLAS